IFLGPIRQVRDEVLDLLTGGLTQGLHPAEIGRIRLDQSGVELMLSNQLAETIADRATPVTVSVFRLRQLLGLRARSSLTSEGADLFYRADADSVGFAQGTVDGTSFGHAHFGTVNQGRNVRRIGITIANESLAITGLKNCAFVNVKQIA